MLTWTHSKVITYRKRKIFAFWHCGLVHSYANMHVTTDWRMTPQGVDDIVNFEPVAECNNFGVQRKGYWHIHGTVMGSPVSVVAALWLHVTENVEWMALAAFHFPLCFYKHYVDYTCKLLPRLAHASSSNHLKCTEPCIQLTVEEESDNRSCPWDYLCTGKPYTHTTVLLLHIACTIQCHAR